MGYPGHTPETLAKMRTGGTRVVEVNDPVAREDAFCDWLRRAGVPVERCTRVVIEGDEITAILYAVDDDEKKYVCKEPKSVWFRNAPLEVETFASTEPLPETKAPIPGMPPQ